MNVQSVSEMARGDPEGGRPPQDEFVWKLRARRRGKPHLTWYTSDHDRLVEKMGKLSAGPSAAIVYLCKYSGCEEIIK